LGNAANALLGALTGPQSSEESKPAVALSMFGVTTPCVTAIRDQLESHYDALVFHATGTGGRAMEKLVGDGLVSAVLDITTTEICDLIAGGVMSAGPQRLDVIARTGVPYVGSCGALDMVNFGARDTVPERYRQRLFYEHNPQVTLMRTTPEECRRIAEFIAAKLNSCPGPVRFLLPEGGVSLLDAPGQPFHDPEADEVLFQTLEEQVRQTETAVSSGFRTTSTIRSSLPQRSRRSTRSAEEIGGEHARPGCAAAAAAGEGRARPADHRRWRGYRPVRQVRRGRGDR